METVRNMKIQNNIRLPIKIYDSGVRSGRGGTSVSDDEATDSVHWSSGEKGIDKN